MVGKKKMNREITTISNPAIISELKLFPNQAVLWEIIDGNNSGKIFELADGAVLISESCSDPFVFIAGAITEQSVAQAHSILKECKFPMVYCDSVYHPLFLEKGWAFHLRVELNLKNFIPRSLDKHLVAKPINILEVFKKCFWYKERSELYGSDEKFIKHGIGYALCLGEQILSEAYASIGGGSAEISVVTHPDYRGKGYASQVLTVLIERCKELNLIPKQTDGRTSSLSKYCQIGRNSR